MTVDAFKKWEEIIASMDDGHFNEQDVTDALKLAGVKGTKMTFDQFVQAYEALQDLLEDYDDYEGDEEGQNSDLSDEDDDEDGDDEVFSDEGESEEQSDEEFLRETFAELKDKKTNKVSVKAFYEWDEIAEVVADGLLTKDDVKAALKDAGVVGKDLTLEQFSAAFSTLQDQLEGTDESDDDDEEDEEEQSDEELMREAFDELKDAKTKKVSAKAFTEWEEIAELVSEGLLTKEGVKDALKAAGVSKDMTFEQFSDVFGALQDQIDANQAEADEDDVADTDSEGEDEEEEDDEQSDEELMREAFDELKDAKTKKVSAKAFTEWEEISDLIKEGYLTKDSVKDALKAAGVGKDMSFEQFSAVFSALQDQIDAKEEEAAGKSTTDTDSDDEEEEDDDDDMSYEEELEDAFNTLKGKDGKVPKKAFQQWSVISDMLKDGSITQGDVKQAFDDAEITGNALDFEEFIEVYEILDEFAYGVDEDDEEGEEEGQNSDPSTNTEEEEDSDEELTAELKSEFKQLTKGNKSQKGSKTITIKTFKSWEPIAELIEDGLLSTTDLAEVLKDLGIKGGEKGGELNESQFIEAYKTIEDLTSEYDDEEEDKDEGQNSDREDDDGEWAYEEKMNEYFDELKGKTKE